MFFAIGKVFQRFFRGSENKVVEMFSTLRAEQNIVERGKLLIWVWLVDKGFASFQVV